MDWQQPIDRFDFHDQGFLHKEIEEVTLSDVCPFVFQRHWR